MIFNDCDSLLSSGEAFPRRPILHIFEIADFYFELVFAALKLIDGLGSSLSRDANAGEKASIKYPVVAIT